MANIKYLKGGPHFNALSVLGIATNGDTIAATATQVTVASDEGHTVVYHGSFTVAGLSVTGGTMTGFDVYAGSTQVMKGRGFAISATAIGDAINAGFDDFISLVFAGAKVVGSNSPDTFFYAAGSKVLARGGNDTLFTFADGAAVLKGGDGDDVMVGTGAVRMSGGEDDDIFAFDPLGGFDRAKDFNPKDDVVGLFPSSFAIDVPVGYLGSEYFRVGEAAQTPTEVVLYNKKTGALMIDPDGTGAIPAFQAGILPDHLKLNAKDFLVGDFF